MVDEISISVVITCYKEGKLLLDAYKSLLNQTDKDFEILIINDKSPDEETNSICTELSQKPNTRVIFHAENGGLAQARKTGYKEMKGNICVPLDADDILPENAIKDIKNAFENHPNAGFIFGNYWKVEVDTKQKELVNTSIICAENGQLSIEKLAKNWILLGTSPCKKVVFESVGGASQQFSYDIDDMDFWIKVLKAGNVGFHVNMPIYTWNRQLTGMNYNLKGDKMLELFKVHSDFFIQNKAAKSFQPVVYGPFLKAKDWNGFKNAITELEKLGIEVGKYKLLKILPNGLLKWLYKAFKSIK